MCDVWGGCGGGQWEGCPDGGCPAIADNSLTVGRHSLKDAVAALGSPVAMLSSLAKGEQRVLHHQRLDSGMVVMSLNPNCMLAQITRGP